MIIDIPLVTPLSRKYFKYASEKDQRKHHRTLDIRLCLQYICDEIILEFVSDNDKENWDTYNLHEKLKASKQFIDRGIVSKMINTKILGNTGVHEGEEGDYSDEDIEKAMECIRDFSLNVFLSYFKENGFEPQEPSWIPTVFSTLPPIYRVAILEKHYAIKSSKFVIDKLSMAYLKSGREEKAREFLKQCLQKQEINDELYSYLDEKLSILKESFNQNIERFSIATNLDEAKENFNSLLPAIKEEERTPFVILVSMILNGSKPS